MSHREIYEMIKILLKRNNKCVISGFVLDQWTEAFADPVLDHPLYFPLPGMPDKSTPLSRFKEWLEVQGWEMIEMLDQLGKFIITNKGTDL